jgi:hypothetical protein
VILLGQGRTVADVADALLFDPDTVRGYFKPYKDGDLVGLLPMAFAGSEALLDATQLAELDAHLQTHLYPSVEAVARCVAERWGVRYIPPRHDRGAPPPGLHVQEGQAHARQARSGASGRVPGALELRYFRSCLAARRVGWRYQTPLRSFTLLGVVPHSKRQALKGYGAPFSLTT